MPITQLQLLPTFVLLEVAYNVPGIFIVPFMVNVPALSPPVPDVELIAILPDVAPAKIALNVALVFTVTLKVVVDALLYKVVPEPEFHIKFTFIEIIKLVTLFTTYCFLILDALNTPVPLMVLFNPSTLKLAEL